MDRYKREKQEAMTTCPGLLDGKTDKFKKKSHVNQAWVGNHMKFVRPIYTSVTHSYSGHFGNRTVKSRNKRSRSNRNPAITETGFQSLGRIFL